MGAPRGASRSGSTTMTDILNEHRRASFKRDDVQLGARGLDGGRSMYLPAEWGPRTWETNRLGDSATTTRRAGLSRARKGFSKDQDVGL